ncbi:MAG: DUF2126 domain-containing protein [Aestuariibacter sp.]
MTITVAITHHTEYLYDRQVTMSPHVFRLRPALHSRTAIKSYSLKIYPEKHFINWQQDPFGNYLARVVFPEKTDKFWFTVDLVAEMKVINPFDFFLEPYAEKFPFKYDKRLINDLGPYLEKQPAPEQLQAIIKQLKTAKPIATVDYLVKVNQFVYELIEYGIRLEQGVQSVEETLTKKSGSCRDSSWLLVQLFRHLGLAARFVSGYLIQLTADEKSLDGPSGPEQDFTDLHAWCEVYIPGAGWIGLDPTSGLFAGEGHIPLACTPNFESAAPVTGAVDQCETEFKFFNKVQRINEPPRVTKPYSEQQWADIDKLGDHIDSQLQELGIHMTMGGEPTFVSIDDMESPQWNTEADGEDKRRLAHDLFMRMVEHYSTGAIRHYGQGKWYPGEPLPRWQYACYWRKDGQALWQDATLLADINTPKDWQFDDAERFAQQLAKSLGLSVEALMPAYEDVLYHLWQEGNLPVDPGPKQAELLDAMSRKEFLAKLERGLDKPVGLILPLQWDSRFEGWQSCRWSLRRGHCFLLPGASPLGYRLPLASLKETESLPDRDPADIPETFPEETRAAKGYIGDELVKTALTIECRDRQLCVFLPPVTHFEHYIAILSAVEQAAKKAKVQVVLEGYTPPTDSRVNKFAVTPDPGVIEVNIHPSSDWRTLNATTSSLYQMAKESRLGTEKFMLDGKHTGTGGGNHVTIGGASVLESPFLRRPDVLRSFITYWQHHPGLSYLFSSLFIGPTSQAPRVDEARDEVLYELEIAFAQMPYGEVPEPWLVDRLLRHLLVDLTGNTHRSEFCIDKLYSPDSASGRLGIVEFRGFEMPPHARMSLVQMLLLRTLLLWFWQQPYHKPLISWGTQLHDRFLLSTFVRQDIAKVCHDLQSSGLGFKQEWLEPFFTFRFPLCGEREIAGMHLQLFNAIEPWHVLGEEATGSGTARYVDSSLERVELKISNMMDDRYVIACNGRRVPLQVGDVKGTFVAGIRYRAWQPPSALHPTIGVHVPLVFDVFDTWSGRSIGGFTYHVTHPGGRNFDAYPVNANEAEGRRIARYWAMGHTSAEVPKTAEPAQQVSRQFTDHNHRSTYQVPPQEPINKHYPVTLDLRNVTKVDA